MPNYICRWLERNDRFECRLAENHFMMISPIIQQTRCEAYLRRQATRKSGVNIADVTSLFTALRVMGPLSRAVLSELTETDMSPKSFPFFAVKEMDIGSASGIRATNLTQTVVVTEFHETLFLNQF